MIDAIILAGGRGSRMASDLPKPLVPLFGVPLITHQIKHLEKSGLVDRIVVSLHYKALLIEDYLRMNHPGSNLIVCLEDTPLGTGGAVRLAMEFVKSEYVIVLNTDNVSDLDVRQLAMVNESAIVVSKGVRRSPYGHVDIINGYAKFSEKPLIEHWTSTGWYLFEKSYIMDYLPLVGSLEKDVLPKLMLRPFRHYGNIWSLDSKKDIELAEQSSEKQGAFV